MKQTSLNCTYHLSRIHAAESLVAIAGATQGHGKALWRKILPAALLSLGALNTHAAPTGGQLVSGQGSITQSATTTTIRQSSQNLSVTWQSFYIAPSETVNFVQPSATAVAVNRVLGTDGSSILGHLNANGRVYLINPNGILFGTNAQVNVGSLVASTFDITSNADGSVNFSGSGKGSIVNWGTITAARGGYVAFIGNTVSNQGTITAPQGTVGLAAGYSTTLTFANNHLLHLQVDRSVLNSLAENGGLIRADGGAVIMTAGARNTLLASVVNNTGVVEAHTVERHNGTITLTAGMDAGTVNLGGTLDTSAADGIGGTVTATAKTIDITDGSRVDASGATGGGTVNIGSGWQGGEGIDQATTVTMASTATVDASATNNGDGGQVTLRADIDNPDSVASVHGTVTARGGANRGDGGRVETSGYVLNVAGFRPDTSAPEGTNGLWLLDPSTLNIVDTSSSTLDASHNYSSSAWSSTISAAAISSALSDGNNVTITVTSGTIGDLGDIEVNAAITKTGMATSTLTLQAINSIAINQPISSSNGALNVTLLADTDHDGTGISILNNDITTNGGDLTFGNGTTATVNDVSTMVGGDVYMYGSSAITLNTASSTAAGGAVTFNGQVVIANTNGINIITQTATQPGGDVTFASSLDSGNRFSLYSPSMGWSDAQTAVASGSGANIGDTYLAVINSRVSNAAASYAAQYSRSWLGGERVIGVGTDAVWRWVTGPEGLMDGGRGKPFFIQNGSDTLTGTGGTAIGGTYTNWHNGEPNNWGGTNLSATGTGENTLQFVQTSWNDQESTLPSVIETNLGASSLTINTGTDSSAGTVTFGGDVGNVRGLGDLVPTNTPEESVLNMSPAGTSPLVQVQSGRTGNAVPSTSGGEQGEMSGPSLFMSGTSTATNAAGASAGNPPTGSGEGAGQVTTLAIGATGTLRVLNGGIQLPESVGRPGQNSTADLNTGSSQ